MKARIAMSRETCENINVAHTAWVSNRKEPENLSEYFNILAKPTFG